MNAAGARKRGLQPEENETERDGKSKRMYWKDKGTEWDHIYLEGDKGMEGKWRTTRRENLAGACGPWHCGSAWLRLLTAGILRAAGQRDGCVRAIGWLAQPRNSLWPPVSRCIWCKWSFRAFWVKTLPPHPLGVRWTAWRAGSYKAIPVSDYQFLRIRLQSGLKNVKYL